jgi:hypothetical protein
MSGWLVRSASVARVSALIGLKHALPSSFVQISRRRLVSSGASSTAGDECLRDRFERRRDLAAGMAQRVAPPFDVFDQTRADDLRRRVDRAADDASRIEGAGQPTARIDAFDDQAFEFAAVMLEVPPRNAVLHRDDLRVRTDQQRYRLDHGRDLMGLERNDHAIGDADRSAIVSRPRMRVKITAFAADGDAALL